MFWRGWFNIRVVQRPVWGLSKMPESKENHLLTSYMSLTRSFNFAEPLFIHHENVNFVSHGIAVKIK